MLIMITGGSKNGKSKIAETIVASHSLKRIYIATMEPFCDEALTAIRRHREMRRGKGFETIEKYTDIGETEIPGNSAVLLECMGNLCANEMFTVGVGDPVLKIISGVKRLNEVSELLVIVTSQVGGDGMNYGDETMKYMKIMGEINRRTAELADCVIEAVYGIPVVLKGEKPECLC